MLIAKAIADRRPLDLPLSSAFFTRALLRRPLARGTAGLVSVDRALARSLRALERMAATAEGAAKRAAKLERAAARAHALSTSVMA